MKATSSHVTLRWRYNGHDSISNHQPHHCLLNRLFRRRSKKTSKLRVTGLCVGNSPVTSEFPAQMASNAENVSIWWRHHETLYTKKGSMTQKVFPCQDNIMVLICILYFSCVVLVFFVFTMWHVRYLTHHKHYNRLSYDMMAKGIMLKFHWSIESLIISWCVQRKEALKLFFFFLNIY